MFRASLVGLLFLSAFSIAFVLVTPDPLDDAIAVVQPSLLRKAYPRTEALKLYVPRAQARPRRDLVVPLPATTSLTLPRTGSQLVDLLGEHRC